MSMKLYSRFCVKCLGWVPENHGPNCTGSGAKPIPVLSEADRSGFWDMDEEEIIDAEDSKEG